MVPPLGQVKNSLQTLFAGLTLQLRCIVFGSVIHTVWLLCRIRGGRVSTYMRLNPQGLFQGLNSWNLCAFPRTASNQCSCLYHMQGVYCVDFFDGVVCSPCLLYLNISRHRLHFSQSIPPLLHTIVYLDRKSWSTDIGVKGFFNLTVGGGGVGGLKLRTCRNDNFREKSHCLLASILSERKSLHKIPLRLQEMILNISNNQ